MRGGNTGRPDGTLDELQAANDTLGDPAKLRARAGRDGYLLLRNLLPPAEVLALRDAILDICAQHGWLARDAPRRQGRVDPALRCVHPDPRYVSIYDRVVCLEAFNRLPHHRAIVETLRLLFGEDVVVHGTKIGRLVFPSTTIHATPAHQDYIHLQGTTSFFTCWITLGDCPADLGGLALLPRSQHIGLRRHSFSPGPGGLSIDDIALSGRWATTTFHAGDVLMFNSLVIHRALPNMTDDRLRLSVDCRYQGLSQPITDKAFVPSGGRLQWSDIYADWHSSDDFVYYWRRLPLKLVPYDMSSYDQRDFDAIRACARTAPAAAARTADETGA